MYQNDEFKRATALSGKITRSERRSLCRWSRIPIFPLLCPFICRFQWQGNQCPFIYRYFHPLPTLPDVPHYIQFNFNLLPTNNVYEKRLLQFAGVNIWIDIPCQIKESKCFPCALKRYFLHKNEQEC